MIRFDGMEIVVHRPQIVQRTWRERLFSWPWRPWQATKLTTSRLFGLDDRYIVMGGQIHCTEKGYEALMREAKAEPPVVPSPPMAPGRPWFQ